MGDSTLWVSATTTWPAGALWRAHGVARLLTGMILTSSDKPIIYFFLIQSDGYTIWTEHVAYNNTVLYG